MIDVIIVNWNAGEQLKDCIRSLRLFNNGLIGKIIVIDNASIDGSEKFAEEIDDVILIRNEINLGFGVACNLGATFSSNKYLLFLNPDAQIYKNTLQVCVNTMHLPAHENVGILGVQLLDNNGNIHRSCDRFTHVYGYFLHTFGLRSFFPRLDNRMINWDHKQTKYVDHVIGAFFLVRRNLFESLGGFDERFFVYLEDLDFSYRAFKLGWRSLFLTEVQAFHFGGGTSQQVKAHRLFYSLRSRLLYGFKHFKFMQAWTLVFCTLTIEPITRTCFALYKNDLTSIQNTWKAYYMLCKDLKNIIKNRSK